MPIEKMPTETVAFQRLEAILGVGYWSFKPQKDSLFWSLGIYRLLGLDPNSIMPDFSVSSAMVHPEDRIELEALVTLARQNAHMSRLIRVIRPDGKMLWIQNNFESEFDRNGSLVSVYGVMRDVTQYQNERNSAEKDRAFLDALLKLIDGEFWRAGPDGRLFDLGSWIKLTGKVPESTDIRGRSALLHPDDRREFEFAWERGLKDKSPIRYRVRIKDDSGKYAPIQTCAVPVLDALGNIIEWNGCCFPVRTNAIEFYLDDLCSKHIRAARLFLDWSVEQLAKKSGVSSSTVKRMENSLDAVKPDSVERVMQALKLEGIEFAINANGKVTISI